MRYPERTTAPENELLYLEPMRFEDHHADDGWFGPDRLTDFVDAWIDAQEDADYAASPRRSSSGARSRSNSRNSSPQTAAIPNAGVGATPGQTAGAKPAVNWGRVYLDKRGPEDGKNFKIDRESVKQKAKEQLEVTKPEVYTADAVVQGAANNPRSRKEGSVSVMFYPDPNITVDHSEQTAAVAEALVTAVKARGAKAKIADHHRGKDGKVQVYADGPDGRQHTNVEIIPKSQESEPPKSIHVFQGPAVADPRVPPAQLSDKDKKSLPGGTHMDEADSFAALGFDVQKLALVAELDGFLDALDAQNAEEDYATGARARPPNQGHSQDIVTSRRVDAVRREMRRAGFSDIRGNQPQTGAHGQTLGDNRPDLQAIHPSRTSYRRVNIEFDTDRNSMHNHMKEVTQRDANARSVFALVDGRTGRTIEKHIWDPRRKRWLRPRSGPVRPSDMFDADVFSAFVEW